jgi:hypothetical protein
MISAAVGGLARVSLEMKSAEREGCAPKKRAGPKALLQKLCRPFFPCCADLTLMDGTALPCWAPGFLPRLGPPDLDLAAGLRTDLLDYYRRYVIHSGNDCSKFEHFLK